MCTLWRQVFHFFFSLDFELNFSLLFTAPTGPPLNLTASNVSPDSILLSWDPPSADEQNGEIILYYINIVEEFSSDGGAQLTSHTNSLEITNLNPFTTYFIEAAAATLVGTGPFTTSITVTTLEDRKL